MSRKDRRALLLGGLALALALAIRAALPAAGAVRSLDADLAGRAEAVARMRANVRGAAGVFDSAAAVRKQLTAVTPRLLGGRSAAEAIADLSGRLAAVAGASGATLEHTSPVEDSTRVVWLRRVTVRAAFESDMRGTLALLRRISREPAALTVRSVRIVAPDPGSADGAPEILKIDAAVSGWYVVNTGKRP